MKKQFLSLVLTAAMLTGSVPLYNVSAADCASGDVNGDGKLSISDVVMLSRYVGEDASVSLTVPANADINGDGSVDFNDATAMLRTIARLPLSDSSERTTRDLMNNITANILQKVAYNDAFQAGQMDFAVNLLQEACETNLENQKNLLISPTSAMYVLAMIANGAKGDTLAEMENTLCGGMDISKLNQQLNTMRNQLTLTDNVTLTDAIWFRDQFNGVPFEPLSSFLQTNADYYGAAAKATPFDLNTSLEINDFVNESTHGMIPEMVDASEPLPADTAMYLLNCLTFEANWKYPYTSKSSVGKSTFYCYSGEEKIADMMYSTEAQYLTMEHATGFIKPYAGNQYSFAALLPEEDMDIFDFVAELDADTLLQTIENKQEETVLTMLPQFSYSYDICLNDSLQNMGIKQAFSRSEADLSGIDGGIYPLFLSGVEQKTFIAVDTQGTKAAAATSGGIGGGGAWIPHDVILDRPFVYMILDNDTNLPLFIGTLLDVGESESE